MSGETRKVCEFSEQDLILGYYRELDAERALALERHLTNCLDCRTAAEQMNEMLKNWQTADLSVTPEAADRFARRVGTRLGRRRVARAGAWGGAFAAASVLLAIAFYPQPVPEITTVERTRPVSAELDILEHYEFLQDMDLLDDLDLLMELWPRG